MRTTAFNSYLFPLTENGETILCDMLGAWKLLWLPSSMDFILRDEEVWTEFAATPLRAKMSSRTVDVPRAIQLLPGSMGTPHKRTQAHAEECGELS